MQEWEKESKLVLVRNPNYKHGIYPTEGAPEDKDNGMLKDAGAKLPFLAKVVRYILVEEQPRWLNFNRGLLDIVTLDKDSYYDAFPTGSKLDDNLKKKGIKVIKTPQLDIYFYSFNMEDKIVGKNKYLRQAISLAYNAQKHNDLFYNNQAYVANWILPPGIFGFDPAYKNPYTQYNIEKAKSLLLSKGFKYNEKQELFDSQGNRVNFSLITNAGNKIREAMGAQIKQDLEKIGIKVDFSPINFNVLVDRLSNSLDWDCFLLGFTGGTTGGFGISVNSFTVSRLTLFFISTVQTTFTILPVILAPSSLPFSSRTIW